MANPIDDFLFEETYGPSDWLEDVGESRQDTISHDGAICTLPVHVEFAKSKAALRFIMGYAYVDENNNLRRQTPIWHPVFSWMYADKIVSITYSKAIGKTEGPWSGGVPFAVYTWARFVVEFQLVPYRVYQDDDVGFEYQRYTVLKNKPYNEIVQIDGGNLKYHCPSVAELNGNPLQSPRVYALLEKKRLMVEWHRVPLDFIQDADGNRPTFSAMEKRVNETAIFGRGKHTLLCETIETTDPYPAPIATDAQDEPLMMVDVTFNLIEFNPDRADTTVDKFGWLLQPGAKRAGTAGETALGWYFATHDATLTGKALFETFEFSKVFQHYSLL